MAEEHLGRGWAFPFRLDDTKTRPAFTEGEQRVMESISSIINTRIGERPHRVKNGVPYGTRFRHLLFENIDAAVDVAKFDTKLALDTWEPRIRVMSVDVQKYKDPNSQLTGILVLIVFRYRTSGQVDTFNGFYPGNKEAV